MEKTIDRRTVLAGLGSFFVPWSGRAESIPPKPAILPDGLMRFAADGAASRPAILILPGSGGLERNRAIYERDARAMNGIGMDAYLVSYYTGADRATLAPGVGSAAQRTAYRTSRVPAWAEHVSDLVSTIVARSDCSGRIGILGVSLGGFVASALAARDQRIGALAVLYGGMPRHLQATVSHMPPLIALHGDADRLVAIAEGKALVQVAKRVGADAELVVYPGEGHGFDFKPDNPDSADAIRRIVGFFSAKLG